MAVRVYEIATSAFGLLAMTVFLFLPGPLWARPGMNDLAVDFPFDGGGMITYTRSWPVYRHLDLGMTIGGGVIKREFDSNYATLGDVDFETKSLVLPFVGPTASLHFEFIGLSLGYGLFYADTDIDATAPNGTTFTGSKSGWGTGFYAPLLVLDFYNSRSDMFFGIGLGGFLGATFPSLEAKNGGSNLATDESPIDGLTITFRTRWIDGRSIKNHQKEDDF